MATAVSVQRRLCMQLDVLSCQGVCAYVFMCCMPLALPVAVTNSTVHQRERRSDQSEVHRHLALTRHCYGVFHSLAHDLVQMAQPLECVPIQEAHGALHALRQPPIHLLRAQLCLARICQRHVPAPHVTEDRHVLRIRQHAREHAAQGGVDACEDLGAAQEACRAALRDEDAAWVELGQHHILVKVLQGARAHSRTAAQSGLVHIIIIIVLIAAITV